MASAILQIPQKSILPNTHHTFYSKNSKLIDKQTVSSNIFKLCSENRLKEAVGALHSIPYIGNILEKNLIYDRLLRSIAAERDLLLARKVYDHMIGSNLHRSTYFGTKIVMTLVECGGLNDAYEVFEGVKDKNLRLWSVILNGFCGSGCFHEVLRLFCDFSTTCLKADGFVLSSVLRACGSKGNLRLGKEIHAFVYRNGYGSDVFVNNCLVDMYGKCDSVGNAREVFDSMPERDVISWNSMLKVCSQGEDFDGFVKLAAEMEAEGVKLNLTTWNTLISGYGVYGCTKEALDCFYKMQSAGEKPDIVSCNALISALANKGYFEEALQLIRQMQVVGLESDVISWTALIKGYVHLGFLKEALSLFSELQYSRVVLDEIVLSVVLEACANLPAFRKGKEIHGHIIKNNLQSGASINASLVDMYGKCGKLHLARRLLSNGNIVSWNILISRCMQNGNVEEAKALFQSLESAALKPDLVSWNLMIDCHAQEGDTNGALRILDYMQSDGVSPDMVSWNTLIKGYTKSRKINDAMQLLDHMESLGFNQNPGSWNTLISNHVNQGDGEKALQVFQLMKTNGVKPDSITISSILNACALLGDLLLGKSVHGWTIRSNIKDNHINTSIMQLYIRSDDLVSAGKLFQETSKKHVVPWNAMISGFAKNGKLHEAQRLLRQMWSVKLNPDVVSWTTVQSGYIKTGNADVALELWREMWQSGIQPDPISITAAFTACAKLGMLDTGKVFHGFSVATGLEKDPAVQASTITMYFKCGNIKEAVQIFEKASHKSTVIWNSMISGYVMHGHGKLAISLFQRMQSEGVTANSITFSGLLSACCLIKPWNEDLMSSELVFQDSGFRGNQRSSAQMARLLKHKLDVGYSECCRLLRSTYYH